MVKKVILVMFRNRFLILGALAVLTAFFAWESSKLKIKTEFNDLLPSTHPYIKIHNKYKEQLGDPFKVLLMLRVIQGDIYNPQTLDKAIRITDELDLIHGVNHNLIYSISSRKIKKVTCTEDAIVTENLMEGVPSTPENMIELRETVRNTQGVYGVWVSRDEKSLLFSASFIPELVDYDVLFRKVRSIIATETDRNHTFYAAGEPVLTGWVYYYQQKEIYVILMVTGVALVCLLFFYFRNLMGVAFPLFVTGLNIIWGVGFCGLLGLNLEPLTLAVPLIVSARALSHSVQITERYFECYDEGKEVLPACIECASSILPPGTLSVLSDAGGILLLAVIPVPIMQNLAYICAFWAIAVIPTVLIFTPLILSFFNPPKNIPEIVDMERGTTQKILGGIARMSFGKAGVATLVIAVGLFGFAGWVSTRVDIGDINPGTPILWKDSDYNNAIKEINGNFPGTDELYIIVKGEGEKAAEKVEFLKILRSFQSYMEKKTGVAGTLSISNFFPQILRKVYGGYPKWERLPSTREQSAQLFNILMMKAAPGEYDLYISESEDQANVIVWYKDHMGETIRSAIENVEAFIAKYKEDLLRKKINFQLASGNIGILAAINETVKKSQFLNFILVISVVFGLCAITYRSFVAAIILMIPLNLSNLITLSIMKWQGIGLNINTLPIVAVGVGVGIDYGIYLLSRMCEESQKAGEYSFMTARKSIKTTGKAIFFTATTMIVGVIFWYFFSSLRFQAEMSLLLAVIMFVNMIGAMILIPSLIYVFKPKFLFKVRLLIKE